MFNATASGSNRSGASVPANPGADAPTAAPLSGDDTPSADATDSALDRLARGLGGLPWWFVSGTFHLLLLTLFVLMLTEIPRDPSLQPMTGLPIEQIKTDPPPISCALSPLPVTRVLITPLIDAPVDPEPSLEPIDCVDPIDSTTEDPATSSPSPTDSANSSAYGSVGVSGVLGIGGPGPAIGHTGPVGPYQNRTSRRHTNCPPGSQNAVDKALEWLAKHQEPDGHWDTAKYQAQEASRCDTAATGMALLAFLGAGHTDKRGLYKDSVKRGLEWITKQQKADGCIMPGTNGKEASYGPGYHHAICGLALAEAYGMAHSPWVKDAAQKAVNYSTNDHQDGKGSEKLGWRYQPKTAGDISVTGWFIMQLKSARLSGLAVPQESFQGGIAFLDSVETNRDNADPYAVRVSKYQPASATGTPMQTMIGCTARMFLGWPKEDLQASITWAAEKKGYPAWGANGENVDWYYLYYGTLATFQIGGDTWNKWNTAMLSMLLDHQRNDGDEKGSWDPTGAYANLGRVWSTTNGALCLEVYYRYGSLYGAAVKH